MKEKKMSKSVYDDFQERSEAIGSKGVVVKAGLVGEGKSFLSQNMTYCPNCGDLVHFTVQDEVLEEEFKGVMNKEMFEKIVQDYLNHGDSVISNKLNNEHRPENQRPQQKTKWQSPETKIIHPAEPSMQERFNRAWKKVNDEEAAAGETDEGALEGAVKCMMEK